MGALRGSTRISLTATKGGDFAANKTASAMSLTWSTSVVEEHAKDFIAWRGGDGRRVGTGVDV